MLSANWSFKLFLRECILSLPTLFKEKNVEIVQKKIRLMINGLANAGLASSQANNEDLRSILDNFLNGGQKTEFGTVLA